MAPARCPPASAEECIVVGDDINNHPRDPRYLDLVAAVALLALVVTALAVTNHGFVTASTQTAGMDPSVRQ
jgi:hypothetical protein